MKQRLDKAGVRFRPHFKTHQSWKIAEIFSQEGIRQITVSSVTMAHYFARQGWKDITIAFPLNLREMDSILMLPEDVTVGLLISDSSTASYSFPKSLLKKSVFWIELDTGHHRSGFSVADFHILTWVIDKLCSTGAHLQGFLFHDGHTYNATGIEEIREIRYNTLSRLSLLREFLSEKYPGRNFLFSGGYPIMQSGIAYGGNRRNAAGEFCFLRPAATCFRLLSARRYRPECSLPRGSLLSRSRQSCHLWREYTPEQRQTDSGQGNNLRCGLFRRKAIGYAAYFPRRFAFFNGSFSGARCNSRYC